MTEYDGKDRRKMSQDQVERDRLLSVVSTDVKNIIRQNAEHYKVFSEHLAEDKAGFKELRERIFYLTIIVVTIGVIVGIPQAVGALIK